MITFGNEDYFFVVVGIKEKYNLYCPKGWKKTAADRRLREFYDQGIQQALP
jgi:hypothetical protein